MSVALRAGFKKWAEGARIAEALIRYEQSALNSIENGKKRET